MSTRTHTTAKSNKSIPAEQIIALPSLSCALSSLPQAKSLDSVSLHQTSMSAQRAAESEAKLKKALSKTAASPSAQNLSGYVLPQSPDHDQGLMMRKPLRSKLQV
ncbi:hypothetical protein JAAARDRAFT_38912 [Jaapia argillacea MUCL 33604]|uniref:Uncharacterized protein n=1 Tax=Jaapia argillacea MUCL 33604 TaxID=933084 RepID=A0A067PUE1_9AGAM|nr:hypothetical protein JAAARDRAFT_38912 [Jaapia argillacea MUCL 33604]